MNIARVLILALAPLACSCTNHNVIAATGTTIGVEVSYAKDTQLPVGKLGYSRAEIAIVPTNRTENDLDYPKGAEETAEVLMELKYSGIFDMGENSGIYQRLAVGKTAVSQPGAAMMFARPINQSLSPSTAKVLQSQFNQGKKVQARVALKVVLVMRRMLSDLASKHKDTKAEEHVKKLDELGANLLPDWYQYYTPVDRGKSLKAEISDGEKRDFASLLRYRSRLESSAEALGQMKTPITVKVRDGKKVAIARDEAKTRRDQFLFKLKSVEGDVQSSPAVIAAYKYASSILAGNGD